MKIQDCIVVITGASSGIGRATAHAFASQGATVVLAARREHILQDVKRECEQLGGSALAIPTDVREEKQVRDLAQQTIETLGRIDIWINNAGVSMFGRFEEVPPESFEAVIRTNLFGYIYGARAVLPIFREQGHGHLINVASIVARISQPYTSAYAVTKAGIRALSDSLREELLDAKDIHVSTVSPATIDTPLFQNGANYTGRAAKAMPPVYPAEDVVKAIISLVKHPRREMMVGGAGRLITLQHALMPSAAERLMAHQFEKNHLSGKSAPPSEGNLFEPNDNWNSISGGWRNGSSNGSGKALAGLLVAAAVPAGIYMMQQKRRHGLMHRLKNIRH